MMMMMMIIHVLEDSNLLESYGLLLGKQSQIFWRTTLPLSLWPTWSWQWRHYNPLKHQELLAPWHSITSLNTRIFSNTAVRTSNLTWWTYYTRKVVSTQNTYQHKGGKQCGNQVEVFVRLNHPIFLLEEVGPPNLAENLYEE